MCLQHAVFTAAACDILVLMGCDLQNPHPPDSQTISVLWSLVFLLSGERISPPWPITHLVPLVLLSFLRLALHLHWGQEPVRQTLGWGWEWERGAYRHRCAPWVLTPSSMGSSVLLGPGNPASFLAFPQFWECFVFLNFRYRFWLASVSLLALSAISYCVSSSLQ